VLQAEAFALHLAMLAEAVQLQTPYFFTNSYVLAKAAAAVSIFTAPGHWDISH
jgi:hypothetical protein